MWGEIRAEGVVRGAGKPPDTVMRGSVGAWEYGGNVEHVTRGHGDGETRGKALGSEKAKKLYLSIEVSR